MYMKNFCNSLHYFFYLNLFQKFICTSKANKQKLLTEIEQVQSLISNAFIVNTVVLNKCSADLSSQSLVSEERVEYLYNRYIQQNVKIVRTDLLTKYMPVLTTLVSCAKSFHQSVQQSILKQLQPSAHLMEQFDTNESATIQDYFNALPKPYEVSFRDADEICTWKCEKLDRKLAFMPESPVMILIRCDVLELMDLVIQTSSTGEAGKFS